MKLEYIPLVYENYILVTFSENGNRVMNISALSGSGPAFGN